MMGKVSWAILFVVISAFILFPLAVYIKVFKNKNSYKEATSQAGSKRIVLNKSLDPVAVGYFPKSMTSDFIKDRMTRFEMNGSGRKPVGNKTFVLGTNTEVSYDGDYKGFLSVVLTAYANHWTLVTSPDDWWLTITQRVATAVDTNSGKESVRNHFVDFQGKTKLVVEINKFQDISQAEFFNQMSQQVARNIRDPGYVSNMQPDFSTTTPLHGIVGNIAIMSSLQEYFEFRASITCGIPNIEMKGTLVDWVKLTTKFSQLRQRLSPISDNIGLGNWWSGVEGVLARLVETFNGDPDTLWWNQIIEKREYSAGCTTMVAWDGWFLRDFLNLTMAEVHSSLVSVPLTVDDHGMETEAALVAGIAGFKFDPDQLSVEAQHAWNLMVDPTSYLRMD